MTPQKTDRSEAPSVVDGTARALPDTFITANCMDCKTQFHGPIGVRVVHRDGLQGIEIVVFAVPNETVHPIARVAIHVVAPITIDPRSVPPIGNA